MRYQVSWEDIGEIEDSVRGLCLGLIKVQCVHCTSSVRLYNANGWIIDVWNVDTTSQQASEGDKRKISRCTGGGASSLCLAADSFS